MSARAQTMLTRSFLLLFLGLTFAAVVHGLNEPCRDHPDCPTVGSGCRHGRCVCWMSMGFSEAQTWACEHDFPCGLMFRGTVCRVPTECPAFPNSRGFCTFVAPNQVPVSQPAPMPAPAPAPAPQPTVLQAQPAPARIEERPQPPPTQPASQTAPPTPAPTTTNAPTTVQNQQNILPATPQAEQVPAPVPVLTSSSVNENAQKAMPADAAPVNFPESGTIQRIKLSELGKAVESNRATVIQAAQSNMNNSLPYLGYTWPQAPAQSNQGYGTQQQYESNQQHQSQTGYASSAQSAMQQQNNIIQRGYGGSRTGK